MAFPILGTPKPAFFDSSGDPLVSGTISTTTSADVVKASYPTAADADASTNGTSGDITLDARGEPTSTQYWGKDNETYKVVIKDSDATTVHTYLAVRMPKHNRRAAVTFTSTDATPTVAESSTFITAGTTAITDFDNGEVGDEILILAASSITITHGSPVSLSGSVNFDMVAGDTLTLAMFNDQVWEEIGRTVAVASSEVVTTTNVITASENGKIFYLNTAAGFTSTLPAPANGLEFEFIVKTAPTSSGGYIVTTNASAAIIFGTIVDSTATLEGNAETTITFVFDTSLVGDSARFRSDGTNWYMTAQSQANGGISRA